MNKKRHILGKAKSWLKKMKFRLPGKLKNHHQLLTFLRRAAVNGLIDHETLHMFEGALNVQKLRVTDVMIPRLQMVIIDNDMPFKEVIATVVKSGHSRFPVIGENKDEVLGILLAKDLLANTAIKDIEQFNIRDILRPAVFIPESKRLDSLLQDFQANRNHIAIVVDEYGGVTGLITIEDVLEQIVGNIEDEYDIEDGPSIKQYNENSYSIKAFTTIEEFNEFFNANLKDKEADTIGGLVTRVLGHLPQRGECIQIKDFDFKITQADNRRIYLLQVTPCRPIEPKKGSN